MRTFILFLYLGLSSALASAATTTVAQVLSVIQKGDKPVLRTDQYTNAAESAVNFLRNSSSIKDESDRGMIIRFAGELMRYSLERGGQHDTQNVEAFVSELVKVLRSEPIEIVRYSAAASLRDTVPPRLIESHQTVLRLAAEERRDIATLVTYASLPSCDVVWLAGIVRTITTEKGGTNWILESILVRCGDRAATDRLIERASNLDEICGAEYEVLVNAFAFAHSERVQKFLGLGLRSDKVLAEIGGGSIAWRNFCASALVRMHRYDEGFPVKREYPLFPDDVLDKLERWCVDTLGIPRPSGVRKTLTPRNVW
jgi:hypothetical protein